MAVYLTVTMSREAGRRFGGWSKYATPRQEFPDQPAAVADLKTQFGGIKYQKDEDYLADLARYGILVSISEGDE